MMNLLKEVTDEVAGVEPEEKSSGPAVPDGWSVGHLSNHGVILSCDGFSMKLTIDALNDFFDIAEDGEPGEIKDQNGDVILVEPTDDSIILTRTGDEVYPSGVTLDLETLADLGIVQDEGDPEEDDESEGNDVTIDPIDEAVKFGKKDDSGSIPVLLNGEKIGEITSSGYDRVMRRSASGGYEVYITHNGKKIKDSDMILGDLKRRLENKLREGVKTAYRRAGKKIKRGFRVTSGFRKGRVVSSIKNAFKPRAKASTRMKLKIASRKKKLVRVMKSKRTRKKSLSKRLVRMNAQRK